ECPLSEIRGVFNQLRRGLFFPSSLHDDMEKIQMQFSQQERILQAIGHTIKEIVVFLNLHSEKVNSSRSQTVQLTKVVNFTLWTEEATPPRPSLAWSDWRQSIKGSSSAPPGLTEEESKPVLWAPAGKLLDPRLQRPAVLRLLQTRSRLPRMAKKRRRMLGDY
ncbi:unnamed protein product, partial [Caretta caretta]